MKDIFDLYGTIAKQYDGLHVAAAQRELTAGERAFYNAFTDMLNGDATEEEMRVKHSEWMQE